MATEMSADEALAWIEENDIYVDRTHGVENSWSARTRDATGGWLYVRGFSLVQVVERLKAKLEKK